MTDTPDTSDSAEPAPPSPDEPASPDEQASAGEAGRGRLPRSQRIGIAVVLLLAAGLGLAAGAGVTPGGLRESIEQRLSGDPEPDLAAARIVAFDASGAHSVEVLLVPTDRGNGECVLVNAGGPGWATAPDHEESTWCWFDGPATPWSEADFQVARPSDRFGLLIEVPLGPFGDGQGAVALVGAVYDDVDAIRVELGDGNEYTFNLVTDNGWFAVIVPDGVADIDRLDGGLVNGVVALELVDIEGRVLATATPDSNWL